MQTACCLWFPPYLKVPEDWIEKSMRGQDAPLASHGLLFGSFPSALQPASFSCVWPLSYNIPAPSNSCALSPHWQLSLHDPFHHGFQRAVSMALTFVPFPVEIKIFWNFMRPNSWGNWFYLVCNSSLALPTGSHWIQQIIYSQTDGLAHPPQSPCRINMWEGDVKIVTRIWRAYKTMSFLTESLNCT